jgi:tetratricopeptide (TPR) repeat protein
MRSLFLILVASSLLAQAPPPHSDRPTAREQGQSSSKDTQIDLSAPDNDLSAHPDSEDLTQPTSEFKPWNPHKAMKNVEVGDYYFKQKNYNAAISRYREALEWKPKDAVATFKLAQALEKKGEREDAVANYQAYLKILPNGPSAAESQKAIDRLANQSATRK